MKLVPALLAGVSALAVGQAAAQVRSENPQAYCGDETQRPCGPLPDDSAVEARGVAPNLERGAAADGEAFRLSVDGAPAGGAADQQRMGDLALQHADIQVQATVLDAEPVLSVAPARPTVAWGQPAEFHLLANYAAFIDRAELRIFDADQNVEDAPLTAIPVRFGERVLWTPEPVERRYRVVLRVYDDQGRFDETAPQTLAVKASFSGGGVMDERTGPSLENQRVTGNIPVQGAAVTISGQVADPASAVDAFGVTVPVDREGRFVVQQIAPSGLQEVAVNVTPPGQAPIQLRRALNLPATDRFFVGIADITAGHRSFDPARNEVLGETADPRKDFVDGRLAFYFKGQVTEDWRITASADTGEQPLEDLFDNFDEKDPRSLLRRLDPDQHYPVYGDDSTIIEDAPTYGRFYVRAERDNALAEWGNFQTHLASSELIRYQRSLYGANLGWRSEGTTEAGERRTEFTGFAADPGTIASREEFASTGGSVYYFRNRDITLGSERVFVEVRDKDSGLVLERQELLPARDYDVNYLQGRVLLRDPPPITADSSLFVRQSSLAGHPVWVVVTYEYSPGLLRPDAFTAGGRLQHWLTDYLRVGATAYHQGEDQSSQDLFGADVLLQYAPGTYLRAEIAQADGPGDGAFFSSTGGYDFTHLQTVADHADAASVEFGADLGEVGVAEEGTVSGYWRTREEGFSGPGELTFGESLDQYGAAIDAPLANGLSVQGKADFTEGQLTERHAVEFGLRQDFASGWYATAGVRSDKQQGQASPYSPVHLPPASEGVRTDVAASVGYQHIPQPAPSGEQGRAWNAYVFGQTTVDHDPGRLENDRVGAGLGYQLTDRLTVEGELSEGDLGFGADARADYVMSDAGSLYLAYALAGENPDAFTTGRLGRLTAGARRRVDSAISVFTEQRYEHGAGSTGWTRAYGVDYSPMELVTIGGRYESGSLADALGYDIDRELIGASVDYGGEALRWSSAVEYREDVSSQLGSRETFATRNLGTWQATDGLRLLAKANLSLSESDQGSELDADYYEIGLGAAYRPVTHDRLNLLAKYTYLSDLPSPAQVDALGYNLDYAQRSHIAAVDATYQLTPRLAVGGKVAYRLGELRPSRDESAPWFDSEAYFWAMRADYQVIRRWDVLVELRQLTVTEASDSRLGALVGVYRHLGDQLKIGAGFNFTDFSDDLGDLSYNERGWFVNVIGKF